jgi:tetratricopeptide (TPR) repeat protein
VPGAAAREQQALVRVATALPRTPEAGWSWRIPVALAALDRARLALDEDPARPETWVMLGMSCSWLDPDLRILPPSPADGWSLERNLYMAQATWCYRRATELQPDNATSWNALAKSYKLRGMIDAQVAAEDRRVTNDPRATRREREQVAELVGQLAAESAPPAPPSVSELQVVVGQLLQRSRPEAAARALDEAEGRGLTQWSWMFADQAAALYMHLGRPADARRVWQRADGCPSEGARECRLAAADWVERDFDGAVRHFRAARAADPKSVEACWGLAMLHAQLGEAGPSREACRAGRELAPKGRLRADLGWLEAFLAAQQAGR